MGHYERLSALDSSFLVFEDQNTHMHLGGVLLLEGPPLERSDGGIDVEAIRRLIAARLPSLPRYRQRLAWVPIERQPVWIDDPHFNLEYHVRHTALPRPGDDDQLKRLVASIMSQPLDRARPLWEVYVIEGLARRRCGVLIKVHHCLADGVSAIDLMTALLSPAPEAAIPEPTPWTPRPGPSAATLATDAIVRAVRSPLALASLGWDVLTSPRDTLAMIDESLGALLRLAGAGLRSPAHVPMNGPIGPHRRVDWVTLDLAPMKTIKQQLGGSLNDVALACVTGAIRQYLQHHRVALDGLGYKVVVPVSTRADDGTGTGGNRVSAWLMPLPIGERDARRRYRAIREMTVRLKARNEALGAVVLTQLADWAGARVTEVGARLTSRLRPYNLIVTNVPGPQLPLYLLESRVLGGFPFVPLFEDQGFGVAMFSYDQRLYFGLNADLDRVPDLDRLTAGIRDAFRVLLDAAHARTRRRRAVA